MRVELILEAIDRASGPIGRVQDAVDKIGKAKPPPAMPPAPPPPPPPGLPARGPDRRFLGGGGQDTGRAAAGADKLAAAQQRAAAAPGDLFGALGSAAAVAAPIMGAVKQFNAYEDVLNEIGMKSGTTGAELAAFGERVRSQARAVNMASTDMLTGIDKLAAGGVTMAQAEAAFPTLARAAVATKSSMDDLSKTTVSLINNLKIDPGQVTRALDAMAQAGKDGQFELKDMAQFFPKLGAQYSSMGQTGQKAVEDLAAALQIMRRNVGSPGEAVTNLQDLLRKITLKPAEKAFKDAGINITEVMEKARKEGTVFETMFDVLNKATGGDISKLQGIFGDKEALGGATGLMQHFQDFLKMRDSARGAQGIIDLDFAKRMGLGVEVARALNVAMGELGTTLGQALAPMVNAKIQALTNLVWQVEAWIKANPELVATIAQVASAMAAALVVLAVMKFAFAVLAWGVKAVIGPFRLLGTAASWLWAGLRLVAGAAGIAASFIKGLASGISAGVAAVGGWGAVLQAVGLRIAGLQLRFALLAGIITSRFPTLASIGGMLASPFAMAGRALFGLGAAMMATPIGWFVAGVAAAAGAAYLLYQHWGAIGPWLAGLWGQIVEAVGQGVAAVVGGLADFGARLVAAIAQAWGAVTTWFGALTWPALPSFSAAIGAVFAPVVAALETAWGAVTTWFGALTWPKLPSFSAAIGAVFAPVVAALETAWGAVTTWFGALTWPKLPSFSAAIGAVFAPVVAALETAWGAVTTWFGALTWPKLPSFSAAIGAVFAPVVAALETAWGAVTTWFGALTWPAFRPLPDVVAYLKAGLDPAVTWLGDFGDRIATALGGAFTRVETFLGGIGERVSTVLAPVTSTISRIGTLLFGPSAGDVKATADQAAAAKLAVEAIGPAANIAVANVTATFASANFQSHGAAMMSTLAAGIRAGAAEAVQAAQQTVQRIRDLLPHSPAKVGPLSDLDRVQFGQTLAGAIRMGAPSAVAAAAALAAGLAASVAPGPALATGLAALAAPGSASPGLAAPDLPASPALASAPPTATAPPPVAAGGSAGVSASGPITVNLTLSPSFQGGGGPEFIAQLRQALPGVAHELAETLRAELDRRERTQH
jgi:TP901 family phage tail tape measure protein